MEHRNSHFANSLILKRSIIFLGDSITEYGEWSEMFPNHKVLNRGIAGDGIHGVLNRLNEIKRHDPTYIFLMIGINDLCFHSPSEVVQSYNNLLDEMLMEFETTQIIVQSILPINNEIYKIGTNNDQIDEVNRNIKAICAQKAIQYADISSEFKDEDNMLKKAFTQDGIHINGIAYSTWCQLLNQWLPTD